MGKGAETGGEGGRHKRNIQSKIDYKDQKEQEHGRSMDVPARKGDTGGGGVVQSQVAEGSACSGCVLKKVNADLGQQLACGGCGRLI